MQSSLILWLLPCKDLNTKLDEFADCVDPDELLFWIYSVPLDFSHLPLSKYIESFSKLCRHKFFFLFWCFPRYLYCAHPDSKPQKEDFLYLCCSFFNWSSCYHQQHFSLYSPTEKAINIAVKFHLNFSELQWNHKFHCNFN